MPRVKFFDPGLGYRRIKGEIDKEIQRVLDAGDLIMRKDLENFEHTLAQYIGVKYCVGVNSGTDALYLALRAIGIGEGDEVITVSHTFIATIEAIIRSGAKPILVDVDEFGLMDMSEVQKVLSPTVKAVIPVHLMGDVCDLGRLGDILKNYPQIKIIEDAAQAIGAESEGKKVGSIGLAGCFSFYPAKILGAYGDGGAVTTNNEEVYKELKLLRNHYDVRQTGLKTDAPPETMKWIGNSRLDNLQAAVLNVRIKHLNASLKKRQKVADLYDKAFSGLFFKTPSRHQGRVYQDYVIRIKNRANFKAYLDKAGIETLGADLIPNHKYKGLGLEHWNLPETMKWIYESLRLPCNENLTDKQIAFIIKTIKNYA